MNKLENFERAFSNGVMGYSGVCECGKKYYDSHNCGYKEELKRLGEEENYIGLEHAVGRISFCGGDYVDACDCWHEKAKKLIAFMGEYSQEIADYFHLEKLRKLEEGEKSPLLEL